MEDKILSTLRGTSVHGELVTLRKIYESLEKKQKAFCTAYGIRCPANCKGTCCSCFTPDLSAAEAEFLAYGLIREGKDELVPELLRCKAGQEGKRCPLYLENSEHHCSVYKWRPIVCRMFGAAASKDKNGNPVFRKCKWNEEGHDVTPGDFAAHKARVLIMSDFDSRMESLETESNETELLPAALEKAIAKIRFLLELEEESKQ